MTFLRNCWYVAGHAEEIGEKPFARTLVEEQVVMFRTASGALVALDDRCPHRFAPLHEGKVCGEQIQCPYHGLRFDSTGACAGVPSGETPPPRAKVRSYPLVSRYGMLWIWMGDAAAADPASIPDFSRLEHDDATWFTGTLHAKGNYQLLVDNLFDLSHVEFIHPYLASAGWVERATHTVTQDGDTVTHQSVSRDDAVPAMALHMDPKLSPVGTSLFEERWDPPSVMQLNIEYQTATGSWIVPSGHFLTPETPTTTHYFLRGGQTVDPKNEQMTAGMRDGTLHIFQSEDIRMIEQQQRNLGDADLMEMQPAILRADAGAIRARRVLAKRIREETAIRKAIPETGATARTFAIAPATAIAVDPSL